MGKFNKEEAEMIYSGLIKEVTLYKKTFQEFKSLEVANKIKKLTELIRKIEGMI